MQNFRNLLVWQKAHQLALLTHRITADFPRDETFGLRSSLRRISVDIPSAIAEGCSKRNDEEFARFLSNALGLGNRLEYQALLSHDLSMLGTETHTTYELAIIEVKKMLNKLIGQLGVR